MNLRRPQSLAEVARRATDGGSFEFELSDFLHEFALRGTAAMLAEPPARLRDIHDMGDVQDAYLAAVATYLAGRIGCAAPSWTHLPERTLSRPWFAQPGRHMRATLLVESPAAFRERNLFVSSNALSVA